MANIAQLLTEHMDIWTAAETEKKSSRGRSNGNSRNVYGVKKLRELILELAVRGKLVPQDPNDEPASELLKRIQAEKACLMAEGKLKKEKPLPPITEDEKPFELPQGWEWVRFQDITTYIQRGKGPEYVDTSPFLVVSQKCVRWAGIDLSVARYISPNSLSKYEEIRFLNNNDLLWNSTGTGTIGRACLYQNVGVKQKTVADSHVTVVRTLFGLEQFLFRYIQSPIVQNEIEAMASGTTNQIELNTSTVIAHLLPLPPLAEQHRIVAKVDALMALCDQLEQQHSNAQQAHETLVSQLLATLTRSQNAAEFNANWQRIYAHFDLLFTTEASIDALKQTLLQLAVMGKLVPQDPDDEPASDLLKRIQAEKAKLIAEGKLKKEKPLPPITDEEKPFELPQGWEWSRLADLFAIVTDGDHQAPPKTDTGIPFLVIGNLNTGSISIESCRYVSEQYFEKLDWIKKPNIDDLLYTVTGSYGIPIKVVSKQQFCVQRHVAILKSIKSTPVDYLVYLLKSKYAFEYATEIATGIAQKTVPLIGLRIMPVPIPSELEQHRIVSKVDALMALCDQLKTRLQHAGQQQQAIADALVAQAVQ